MLSAVTTSITTTCSGTSGCLVQGRRQVKQSGVDSMGRVSPPMSGDRVWGYNLKLISTLHNDSIPETPSGKKWGGHVHPSPPMATPLILSFICACFFAVCMVRGTVMSTSVCLSVCLSARITRKPHCRTLSNSYACS